MLVNNFIIYINCAYLSLVLVKLRKIIDKIISKLSEYLL